MSLSPTKETSGFPEGKERVIFVGPTRMKIIIKIVAEVMMTAATTY